MRRRARSSSAPFRHRKPTAAPSMNGATVRRRCRPGQSARRPTTKIATSHGSAIATSGSATRRVDERPREPRARARGHVEREVAHRARRSRGGKRRDSAIRAQDRARRRAGARDEETAGDRMRARLMRTEIDVPARRRQEQVDVGRQGAERSPPLRDPGRSVRCRRARSRRGRRRRVRSGSIAIRNLELGMWNS